MRIALGHRRFLLRHHSFRCALAAFLLASRAANTIIKKPPPQRRRILLKKHTLISFMVLIILGWSINARANVITDWNTAALNAIRLNSTPPPVASRALAILHASIYDAVNGISRSHEAYFVQSEGPARASREAAASAAAHKVLSTLFPNSAAAFAMLHATTLAAIRNGPQRVAGVAWGESVA